MAHGTDKIIIHVDRNLAEIVPDYLNNRRKDVRLLSEMLAQQAFESMRVLGHRMKGTGAGYGFNFISQIGHDLEHSAQEAAQTELVSHIAELDAYLSNIDVRYT